MRLAVLTLFACVAVCVGGCSLTPNAAFVSAVDANCDDILPKYLAYVNADATLDDTSKRIRTIQVEEFQALIDAAGAVAGLEASQ